MQDIAIRFGICAGLAILTAGCASPYVGTWEHDDGRSYLRVVLADDDMCTIVAGRYVGKLREGIGGRCRYARANDIVSITAVGEIDGTGPLDALPTPMQFKFQPENGHLVALGWDHVILRRLPR